MYEMHDSIVTRRWIWGHGDMVIKFVDDHFVWTIGRYNGPERTK